MKTLSTLILLLVLAWSFDAAASRWDHWEYWYMCRDNCDRYDGDVCADGDPMAECLAECDLGMVRTPESA